MRADRPPSQRTAGWEPLVDPGHVTISVDATPVLSYAMAHNGVSVISRLQVDGVAADVRGAVLRIEVRDATGAIGAPVELLLDLDAGRPAVLTDLRLVPDPAAMLQVEERRPGVIRAELEIDGAVVAEHTTRVRILAAHQWLAQPLELGLELLAAHVMPNHPAVVRLMDEVRERLRAATGSGSTEGYQSGPERVDEVVGAVCEALRVRGIRYSEPPASWADAGQKIRTPGEVLDGRVGTCLDLVVVAAAALEQAGIRPLLWMADGHAFLGYWREESSLGAAARTEVAEVVNRVDLGQIGLVETTWLTEGHGPGSPHHGPRHGPDPKYLTGDLAAILGVADVHQARRDRIVPLPARTRDADGNVTVTVYAPADPTTAAPPRRTATQDGATAAARAAEPVRVRQWKNALLDLSLRNRLINFSQRSGLALAVPGEDLALLEDVLHQGRAVWLRPADQLSAVDRERGVTAGRELPAGQRRELLADRHTVFTDVPEAGYLTRLRGLAYRARTIVEETGANNLYLALGTLLWELDGRPLRSPLVLVPVRLMATARGGRYRVALDETGSSTPNYCLVEKLRQVHGLDIPGLAEPAADDAGIDLAAAFTATRAAIAAHELPFRVEPTADLAVLQFAKFRLWKDLDENWPALVANPLVAHLVHTPTEAFADPVTVPDIHDLEALAERCPVPADASQLVAVADAVGGRTFVLEGPPGTGKSQTITNLLVHAVAEGKRVLFVAEKRAALDVVQRRLNAVGMGPLALDLHDKGSKPAAVREQLKHGLDHLVAADHQGLSATVEQLRAARRGLTRYAYTLHEVNRARLSLYAARDAELAIGDDVAPMPVPESFVAGPAGAGLAGAGAGAGAGANSAGAGDERDPLDDPVGEVRRLLTDLPDVAAPVRPRPDHPWAFVDDPGLDVAAVAGAARRFDTAIDAALGGSPEVGPTPVGRALAAARSPADLRVVAALLADGVPTAVLDETRSARWHQAADGARRQVADFAAAAHPGLDLATPAALDLPLAEIDAAARAAAASGFFGRRKRLAAVRDRLQPALRPGVEVRPKRVPQLAAALVAVQNEVRRLAAAITAIPGITLPPAWNPFTGAGRATLDRRIDWLRWAGRTVDPAAPDAAHLAGPLRAALGASGPGDPGRAAELAAAAEQLSTACRLDPAALRSWAGDRGLAVTWTRGRAARDLADGQLRRWLALLAHLEPLRRFGLTEARALLLRGELHPDDARRAFELGLARTTVAERLRGTGLGEFDAAAHERGIARFVAASAAVREHLASAIPHQVVRSRTFDPAATGGHVGQLRRQLGLKRRGMKVRELMATFGDLITHVMPCVLVSPDSLARFFPAGAVAFDIVVFDEASQIRVADAIGAMGRARSVVVVGDSEQLPPTTFGESTVTDDLAAADLAAAAADDAAVEDEESILGECVQARVARHRLTWHYRSQDESLIAFSNHHHYDGSLQSFPAPPTPGTGVSFVRVDGHFHRSGRGALLRTNPVEAEAVVGEILRRFDAEPHGVPSLGVVTFNQQQRAYIEGLLRDTEDPRVIAALDADDGVFVKNLENVQGDERDAILFSTAFSVNERGELPLNFGPLNRAGGERRLNVAVTRARRQVVVFCSFDPEQLRAERTSSVGVRNLRTYLELAAAGAGALPRDPRRRAVPDRHRDQLADALRARGLAVRTDVGLSEFKVDLAVATPAEPHQPLVAVLLDGPVWAARRTVRDRDGLPVEVLAGMLRWPAVERVWLPAWLTDPDAVLDRLESAVARAAAIPEPAAATAAVLPLEIPEASPVLESGSAADSSGSPDQNASRPPEFVAWTPRPLGTVAVLDALPAPAAAAQVRAALDEVVRAEGPVHLDRLAKLVAGAFGLNRVVDARRSAILRQLPPNLAVDEVEPVVWPAGLDPAGWTAFRPSPDGGERPIDHVPLREIANAMTAACRASAGMSPTELRREVLRTFGGRRLTTGITTRLDAALELGLKLGRLRPTPSGQVLAA